MHGSLEHPNRWSLSFQIGLPGIDAEHRAMLLGFETVERAIRVFAGDPYHVERQIKHLVRLTRKHLIHELKLMEWYAYPGRHEHIKEHQVLFDETERLLFEVKAAKEFRFLMPPLKQLRRTTEQHILTADATLAAFIRAHPASQALVKT